MRKYLLLTLLSVALAIEAGCTAQPAPTPEPELRPTATIKDIMLSSVDPSADVLWESVATLISETGIEERAPATDEEWLAVKRAAVQLVEAPNLLLIPGRHVARPGEKSEYPGIELEPEAMQKLIDEDSDTFRKLAYGLQDAAVTALKAIDTKNAKDLFNAGETIDAACEACHKTYWYPPESHPIWKK